MADAHKALPEVPNIFTLLSQVFIDSPYLLILRGWEAVVFSLLLGGAIVLFFSWGARTLLLIPGDLQNFCEWVVETIHNNICEILGPEGKKFVPFLGTIFLYILAMNWLVLIPFMKAPSSSLNITVALAICVFVLVQYLNIKNRGFFGFLYFLAGSPKNMLEWFMVPLLFPIEVLTQLTRPLTLALRLFGNVFGEDVLIGVFAVFGVAIFSEWSFPLVAPLQIPFLFLALFTGLMQAFVFTLLSTIYILLSIPGEDGH